jgi:hypothetical protein
MIDHERIWLEPAPGADEDYGQQWCQHNVWGDDAVEYVRADNLDTEITRLQNLVTSSEQERIRSCSDLLMRMDAKDAELARLREIVERAQAIISTATYPNWHAAARAALPSNTETAP